jgi:hypothetical protein
LILPDKNTNIYKNEIFNKIYNNKYKSNEDKAKDKTNDYYNNNDNDCDSDRDNYNDNNNDNNYYTSNFKTMKEYSLYELQRLTKEFNNENYLDKNLFTFPGEYSRKNNRKYLYERLRNNGDIINFYEDNIISLLEKNKKFHLIYEDGAILSCEVNNDLRLILPNGDVLYNHKNADTFEINYYKENYTIIRYLGGHIEKLFLNGIRINKNPSSKQTIISLLDNTWLKMFDNNGKLLRLVVKLR